jgi:hypothetical protein
LAILLLQAVQLSTLFANSPVQILPLQISKLRCQQTAIALNIPAMMVHVAVLKSIIIVTSTEILHLSFPGGGG